MPSPDRGSFKDPGGFVAVEENRVFRHLTPHGQDIWSQLKSSGLIDSLVTKGWLVPTWEVARDDRDRATRLEHELIPFLSYPYEWAPCFLRSAALLHLDLLEELLPRGFTLKDATPYNVQFVGGRPVFIDVLSIEPRVEGDPWAGYGQFCDTMLYPLLLHYYKRLPYHDWLRGSVNGIAPEKMTKLFGWTDVFRSGVLFHVKLRGLLHSKVQNPSAVKRSEIQSLKLPVSALLRNIRGLRTLIESLSPAKGRQSHWATYVDDHSYSPEQYQRKKALVERAIGEIRPALAWDIGCNTGDFSEIAERAGAYVISFDSDADSVEALARRATAEKKRILPLVMDLTNPSPGMGWANEERKGLFERGTPDVLLALALVHHLAVRGNVPLSHQLALFARAARHAVVEYVDREDAMFKNMVLNVSFAHQDYNRDSFERAAQANFEILSSEELTPTRALFVLKSRRFA